MKIKLLIISILVILLCSGGCDFWKKSHVTVPTLTTSKDISISVDKINKNSKEIKEKTKNIKESSEEIKNSVYKIDDKIDNNVKEKIDIHLKSIKDGSNSIIANAGSIYNNVANITSSTSAIKESNKQIKELEKLVIKLEKERDKAVKDKEELENKAQEQLNTMLIWLIGISIIGIAGFAILFIFSGSKAGIIGCGVSALVLVVATTLKIYFLYVAIAGGILLFLIVGFMIYNILTKNKAFKEVIDTVEIAKNNLSSKKRKEIFGEDGELGMMSKIQSKNTIALIKQQKAKISQLWRYAKDKDKDKEDS